MSGAQALPNRSWRHGNAPADGRRDLPQETPIAMVHDATTTAVMMATPADLEDFGLGFSLTEGIVERAADIRSIEIAHGPLGAEVRMWLNHDRGEALTARRRHLAGPTGCGLCGIDSLTEAARPPRAVTAELTLTPADIQAALAALREQQTLNAVTRAVHAAGFWTPADWLLAAREDVGRHNALDKLVGALSRREATPPGAVVLTSRVSVEMVQKSAVLGSPVIIAVSAPTALAVRMADEAGITLIAIARDDGFEVFTHPRRVANTADRQGAVRP